jgi:RNA polymerase sigma-70 factor (ECF subfamily)
MSAESLDDAQLIADAQAGQRLAFERLLVRHQDRLAERIRSRMPARLRGALDEDDILQDTFAESWKSFAGFRPEGPDALFRWLAGIAEHRLLNAIKTHAAVKRGGQRRRVTAPDDELTRFLSLMGVHQRTPSRSVANREALEAVRAALPGLKDDHREVLRLRFLEGVSILDTAQRMNRSEWAVHKLTARALASLRDELGDAARFLSSG